MPGIVKNSASNIWEVWADLRDLVRSRRTALVCGFLLMVVNRASGLVLPGSAKYLLDRVLTPRRFDLIGSLLEIVLAATVVQGVTSFLLNQLVAKNAQGLIAELREKVQRHITRLPVAFHDSNKTGMLVSRVMSDVEGIRNLFGAGLIDFAGALLTAFIAVGLLLRISPPMTLAAMGVIAVFSVVLWFALKTVRPIFRERGEINAEVTGRLAESLGGVRVIKGYRAEEREALVFLRGSRRLLANATRAAAATSFVSMSATLMMGAAATLIMYVGARQIVAGALTIGDFGAFIMLLIFLITPMIQIVSIGTQFSEAIAGLERTHEILASPPEDGDPARTTPLPEIIGHIVFDRVWFEYQAGSPVLQDLSFEASPGSVTALVGPSGSGKSTITGLIAAFHKAGKGSIFVDGVDISTVRLDSFRSQLGLVLQETFLFDGTIRENIMFARPDADDERFQWACHIARVDDFAERLPFGYETIVGERGVKLSGGQKQRVAIARAILADPRILILDEATSSLDSESEAFIQQGLQFLMEGRTTFVIAHRLSTIRRANQILVIEDGRLVEQGSHEALYAGRGRYYDLYTKQHAVQTNLFLAEGEGNLEHGEIPGNDSCPEVSKQPDVPILTTTSF